MLIVLIAWSSWTGDGLNSWRPHRSRQSTKEGWTLPKRNAAFSILIFYKNGHFADHLKTTKTGGRGNVEGPCFINWGSIRKPFKLRKVSLTTWKVSSSNVITMTLPSFANALSMTIVRAGRAYVDIIQWKAVRHTTWLPPPQNHRAEKGCQLMSERVSWGLLLLPVIMNFLINMSMLQIEVSFQARFIAIVRVIGRKNVSQWK